MTNPTDADPTTEWVYGVSDPNDFSADTVKAALETADTAERQRIMDLETTGKDRVTVANAPVPPSPTAPSAQTLAALGEAPSETAPEAEDPDALKPGDQLPPELHPFQGEDPSEGDGYDRLVVSTDGTATEVTELVESEKSPEPLVVS